MKQILTYFKKLSRHLTNVNDKNHKKSHDAHAITRPTFELRNSETETHSVAVTPS
jgi:endonuclease YncB( thermonuclease family)